MDYDVNFLHLPLLPSTHPTHKHTLIDTDTDKSPKQGLIYTSVSPLLLIFENHEVSDLMLIFGVGEGVGLGIVEA